MTPLVSDRCAVPSIEAMPSIEAIHESVDGAVTPLVQFAPKTVLICAGRPVRDTLFVMNGGIEVRCPGSVAVQLEGPILFDRWIADVFGHSRIDAVTSTVAKGFRVDSIGHAQLLGAFPTLRRLSVLHRTLVMGDREHLPHTSRSSM